MGDKIIVERIVLLYGHLYQIDIYNEDKDLRSRIFIEKEQIEQCEVEQWDAKH